MDIPKGYCYKFKSRLECLRCNDKRACYKCNMTHPVNRCSFRPSTGTSPKNTPVKIDRLLPLLPGYDVELVHALYQGCKFGFFLHFCGPHTSFHA